MARTRAEISALVVLNTGRSDKTSIINSQCDNALKIALTKHPFQDSLYVCDDIAITEDSPTVSISSLTRDSGTAISNVLDIVTARIVDATLIAFTSGGTEVVVAGDVITGSTSGATAYVTYVPTLSSGSFAAGTAAGNLWICNKSGTFTAAEEFEDSDGNNLGTITADPGVGGTSNTKLTIKNRQWWDKNVINPEDGNKGWPNFGLKFGSNIILDRPADGELHLRLRVSSAPVFAADATECPIELLDIFVEQYVTAMTYLSLGMQEKYVSWYIMALGRNFDTGTVGGSLLAAIQKDRSEIAEDKSVERGVVTSNSGIAIKNLTTGNTNSWY